MNVKTLCLGVLELGEASGYEIRKMTQEGRFSHFLDASYGAIYPALAALESEGLVISRPERHPGRPDRKVYAITSCGREALISALDEPARDDVIKSEFLFILRFAELTRRSHVKAEIDRRLEWLDENIERLCAVHEMSEGPAGRFAYGYGRAVYQAMRDYLAQNREMIEQVAGSGLAERDAAE